MPSSTAQHEQHESSEIPRLLVIDDEPAVLKMVKAMLVRAQYRVVTGTSGNEGLKLLSEQGFDCIITDAIMPSMTGYDFVKAVRRHPQYAGIPVLMLTRKRHRQDVKKAVDAGVTDYVLKPIDEHLLLDKVEICLKKGDGKRHVFECAINGAQSEAEVVLACRIISMSENDLTVRTAMELHSEIPFQLRSRLFDEIGIAMPLLKLIKCTDLRESLEPGDVFPSGEPQWESRFSFVGVAEPDLRKIRTWLQKQEIQRRK